jgi:phosphatidylglycerophosphatase A
VSRPGPRFLFGHPANFIALGFGVGLIPFAPGTFGTLLALPIFHVLHPLMAAGDFLLLLGFLYVAGIWICDKAGRNLGVEDHAALVWDEIVAFLLVLFFTPPSLLWQAIAFLLFRLFDIFKPGPIRAIERMFRGGFGVMVDDLVAAFCSLLCLTLLRLLVPMLGGLLGPILV